jgi:hypothetical protein
MAVHTPGPWSIYDWFALGGVGYEIEAPDGMVAASYFTGDRETSLANARIIAVAPDLCALVVLAQRMRAAQTAYFRDRTQANLQASKALEADFDRIAATVMARARGEETATQPALIGDTDANQ